MLLAQIVGGGHGRWVIPRQRLGAEHVTDFLVGEKSSIGFEWLAVELESPKARMSRKSGDPTQTLNHAVRQITDWGMAQSQPELRGTRQGARGSWFD